MKYSYRSMTFMNNTSFSTVNFFQKIFHRKRLYDYSFIFREKSCKQEKAQKLIPSRQMDDILILPHVFLLLSINNSYYLNSVGSDIIKYHESIITRKGFYNISVNILIKIIRDKIQQKATDYGSLNFWITLHFLFVFLHKATNTKCRHQPQLLLNVISLAMVCQHYLYLVILRTYLL